MYQDYKNGGSRHTNLSWFIIALKAGWLRRIFDENNKGLWKEYYRDCKKISKENHFLQDVLIAWSKLN